MRRRPGERGIGGRQAENHGGLRGTHCDHPVLPRHNVERHGILCGWNIRSEGGRGKYKPAVANHPDAGIDCRSDELEHHDFRWGRECGRHYGRLCLGCSREMGGAAITSPGLGGGGGGGYGAATQAVGCAGGVGRVEIYY